MHGAEKGIKFSCVICESRPKCEGYIMYEKLVKAVPCTFIVDSALGCILEDIDIVIGILKFLLL